MRVRATAGLFALLLGSCEAMTAQTGPLLSGPRVAGPAPWVTAPALSDERISPERIDNDRLVRGIMIGMAAGCAGGGYLVASGAQPRDRVAAAFVGCLLGIIPGSIFGAAWSL